MHQSETALLANSSTCRSFSHHKHLPIQVLCQEAINHENGLAQLVTFHAYKKCFQIQFPAIKIEKFNLGN